MSEITKDVPLIESATLTIMRNNLPMMVKLECFGYLINRICETFIDAAPSSSRFYSANILAKTQKQLDDLAKNIGTCFDRGSVYQGSDMLRHFIVSISAEMQGKGNLQGDWVNSDNEFKILIQGVLLEILDGLNSTKFNAKSNNMANLRKILAVRGVLYNSL